jgi:hypothetical protein
MSHYTQTTWYNLPAQIDAILSNQRAILAQGVQIMSALSDAVAKIQATFATLSQEIGDNATAAKNELDALAAAIAAQGGTSPDVQTAVDNLTSLNDAATTAAVTLKSTTDSMVTSLPKT